MNNQTSSQQAYPIMQAPYPMQYAEDEINLVDLWLVFSGYKHKFLKVLIGIIVLGGIYALFIFQES